MSRSLFLQIVDAVKDHDNYFKERKDALGKLGLSTLQKIMAAIRMLAYALPVDATDEYIKKESLWSLKVVRDFVVLLWRYLRSAI